MPARRTLLLNALLLALLASGYAWYTVRHGRTPMPPAIVVRTMRVRIQLMPRPSVMAGNT